MVRLAALIVLAGCSYPHVPAAARDMTTEAAMAVAVLSSCSEPDPLTSSDPVIAMLEHRGDVEWQPSRGASGVVLSSRYVLTAAHAVACPLSPTVHVFFADGRNERVIVERDDAMFGAGADIARLELFGGGAFGQVARPPVTLPLDSIGPRDTLCAALRTGLVCGELVQLTERDVTFGIVTRAGDSGAGVYDRGALIGVVTEGSETMTRAALVGPYWTEGL